MTRVLAGTLSLVVLTGFAPVLAQEAKRTSIVGFPPYLLGVDQAVILSSDQALSAGNWPFYSSRVETVRLGKRIVAPIGGQNYAADLGLEFLSAKLAVVIIHWPFRSFDTASEWRRATRNLYEQLISVYDQSLMTKDSPGIRTSGGGGLVEWQDTAGNRLTLLSSSDRFTVWLTYRTPEYIRAFDASPEPKGNY